MAERLLVRRTAELLCALPKAPQGRAHLQNLAEIRERLMGAIAFWSAGVLSRFRKGEAVR